YRGKIADKFETGRAFLRQRFGCSSTSSRRNPKRSRTTVEQQSNNTRTRVEQQSKRSRSLPEAESKPTRTAVEQVSKNSRRKRSTSLFFRYEHYFTGCVRNR